MNNNVEQKTEQSSDYHVSGRRFERLILPKMEAEIIETLHKYKMYDDKTMEAVRVGVRYSLRFFFKLIKH